ncbi:MAG: signal peptidase I [Anaerovorax sp.]
MKKASKTVNILFNVLLWVIVIIAAFFSIITLASKSDAGVANVAGYTPMSVLTDSMKGEFNKGDLIIVHQTDPAELKEGDIISFWTVIKNKKVINTHRIVKVLDSNGMIQFVTKGDMNDREDDLIVSSGDLVGKYGVKVPVIGSILKLLSSSVGFLVIIVLPLLIFFVWQLYKLIILVIEMKKEAVREVSESARAQMEAEIREKLEAEAATEKVENASDKAKEE